ARLVTSGACQPVFERLPNTVAHLAGSLLGECNGDKRVQRPIRVGVQQRQIALDEYRRFAGTGPGDDDNIAVKGRNRPLLIVGEVHAVTIYREAEASYADLNGTAVSNCWHGAGSSLAQIVALTQL